MTLQLALAPFTTAELPLYLGDILESSTLDSPGEHFEIDLKSYT